MYTGQQQEPGDALGLYNYRARFYSTVVGRFVSGDPVTGDGLNRYTYARNNPLRFTDPSGHCVGGLYCDPSKALNIAVCARGARACAGVFFAMGLAYEETRIAAAVSFSSAAFKTLEFQTNLYIYHSPFLRDNYSSLKAGYSDPGYADTLLLSVAPQGTTVSDIHAEFETRQERSRDILDKYDDICRGGRCVDALLDGTDLALIILGIQSQNPGAYLVVADGALYTADVQRHWNAYLEGEEPLDAVWWSVGGGIGNLLPADRELMLFAIREYAEVFCGSPPNFGCGYRR